MSNRTSKYDQAGEEAANTDIRDATPPRAVAGALWRSATKALRCVGDMADLSNRHSIRMRGYDYASEGAYFVTICTDEMRHLFGRIANGTMATNALGDIAQQCWDAIPQHMPHVDIGEFVVMPNHVHGIVVIRERLVAPAGARHDASGTDAPAVPPDTTANDALDVTATPPDTPTTDTDNTGVPEHGATGGNALPSDVDDPHTRAQHDDDVADEHDERTRARHDAPLRDAPRKPPGIPRGALGQIVASYKSAVSRIAYRDGVLPRGTPIWQRNYWDDIIWDHASYERITRYIRNNPANWRTDDFHG